MPNTPKMILMVVTSHGDINDKPTTGIWFTEFSEPFATFVKSGATITVASPKGGPAPVDPRGYPDKEHIASVRDALAVLNATVRLSSVAATDFDAVFFPGGHGPMFDLATDQNAKALIRAFWESGKPVAAVCHGPAALLDVTLSDGSHLLRGKTVTGFSKGEDATDALFSHMPFSLADRMIADGAQYIDRPPQSIHVEADGNLVTGQNPASAQATAEAFLDVLHRVKV